MRCNRILLLFCLLAMAVTAGAGAPAGELPNHFARMETWEYPSGLRVHYTPMPDAGNVYMAAVLPVGGRHDPPGREGLAHFLEHMMFADQGAGGAAAFKGQVLERGGRSNAITTRYYTRYYLDLPAGHWEFGVRWMRELLRDHELAPAATESVRQVVALEKSRREPDQWALVSGWQDWLRRYDWLQKPDVWEREFGLQRERRSVLGSNSSLRAVHREELRDFYQRYYVPANVTLLLAGNAPVEAVRTAVDRSFGHWRAQGETVLPRQGASVRPGANRFQFGRGRNADYYLGYQLPNLSGRDLAMAGFTARFLRHWLNQELRRDRQLTYGVSVNFSSFDGHGLLGISGNYRRRSMARVESLIEEALEKLKSGNLSAERFADFRRRAVNDLYLDYQSPAELTRCSVFRFCNKALFDRFPDRIARWEGLSQGELADWSRKNLGAARRLSRRERESPLPRSLEWLLATLAPALVIRSLGRRWQSPVAMREVRYVTRIRYPVSLCLGGMVAAGLLLLFPVIWGYPLYLAVADGLSRVDSYWLQRGGHLLLLTAAGALLAWLPSLVPRRILLFRESWCIKSWSFRSVSYPYGAVRELRECTFWELLRSGRLAGTRILHWGLFRPGVYLRVGKRKGYFLRVRDNRELMECFHHWGGLREVAAPPVRAAADVGQVAG